MGVGDFCHGCDPFIIGREESSMSSYQRPVSIDMFHKRITGMFYRIGIDVGLMLRQQKQSGALGNKPYQLMYDQAAGLVAFAMELTLKMCLRSDQQKKIF